MGGMSSCGSRRRSTACTADTSAACVRPQIPPSLAVPLPPGAPGGALGLVLERSRQLCLKTYRKEPFAPTAYRVRRTTAPASAREQSLAAQIPTPNAVALFNMHTRRTTRLAFLHAKYVAVLDEVP